MLTQATKVTTMLLLARPLASGRDQRHKYGNFIQLRGCNEKQQRSNETTPSARGHNWSDFSFYCLTKMTIIIILFFRAAEYITPATTSGMATQKFMEKRIFRTHRQIGW